MKELHCESMNELPVRTKELRDTNKKHSKEARLIQNLKMLMRDFNRESLSMLDEFGDF